MKCCLAQVLRKLWPGKKDAYQVAQYSEPSNVRRTIAAWPRAKCPSVPWKTQRPHFQINAHLACVYSAITLTWVWGAGVCEGPSFISLPHFLPGIHLLVQEHEPQSFDPDLQLQMPESQICRCRRNLSPTQMLTPLIPSIPVVWSGPTISSLSHQTGIR